MRFQYPYYYIYAMDITGFIGFLWNLFTLYLIVKVAPEKMKTYRYFLMFYQISSISIELLFHFAIPELYFPILAARHFGFMYTLFRFDMTSIFEIGFFLMLTMIFAVVQCFCYRYSKILPRDHWLNLSTRTWALLLGSHFVVATGFGAISIYVVDFQHPANASSLPGILQDFPEYSFFQEEQDVWIANISPRLSSTIFNFNGCYGIVLLISILVPYILMLGFVLIIHSFTLLNIITYMSLKTREMHKKLMKYLIWQVMIPFFTVAIPMGLYAYVIIFKKIVAQEILNIATCFASFHAAVSSLLIAFLTEPYRRYMLTLFKKVFRKLTINQKKHSLKEKCSKLKRKLMIPKISTIYRK